MFDDSCLFCKIIQGKEPSDKVFEDDNFIVIKNKYPKAPVHLLVIPKDHLEKGESQSGRYPELWKNFYNTVANVIKDQNLGDDYQLIVNSPARSHFLHEHMHILSGKDVFDQD